MVTADNVRQDFCFAPKPGSSFSLPLEQPWVCSHSSLDLDVFLSNPVFHQEAEIFSPTSETQAGVTTGWEPCSEVAPGVSCAALPMECWCELGLAQAVGQGGSQGPSSPSELAPLKEQTQDKQH